MKLKLFYCVVLSQRGQKKKKNSPCFKLNVIFAPDTDGNKSFAGYIPVKGMKETSIFLI